MEIWEDIPGYEGKYQASSLGNIRSLYDKNQHGKQYRIKLLNINIGNHGYGTLILSLDGNKTRYLVHRLIAKTFINNYKNSPEVNHINGIKTDNEIENLEWVTCSENIKHGYDNKLIINNNKGKFLSDSPKKQKVNQYNLEGGLIKEWGCKKEAAIMTNTPYSGLISVIKGRQKTAGGYIWK